MPLGSTTGGMELNLNQTGIKLGDPTYDENDEEAWQQIAARARKQTPTGQQPTAAAVAAPSVAGDISDVGLHGAASAGDLSAVVALLSQPGAIGRIVRCHKQSTAACDLWLDFELDCLCFSGRR